MQQHSKAIFGGAIALTSFFAVGAGAAASTAAGASGAYGSPAVHASTATMKPVVSFKVPPRRQPFIPRPQP